MAPFVGLILFGSVKNTSSVVLKPNYFSGSVKMMDEENTVTSATLERKYNTSVYPSLFIADTHVRTDSTVEVNWLSCVVFVFAMPRLTNDWNFLKSCTKIEFETVVQEEDVSARDRRRANKTYACKHEKRHNCPFKLRAQFSDISDHVDIFTAGVHDHSVHASSHRLPDCVVTIATKGSEMKFKPRQIRQVCTYNFKTLSS